MLHITQQKKQNGNVNFVINCIFIIFLYSINQKKKKTLFSLKYEGVLKHYHVYGDKIIYALINIIKVYFL